MELYMNLASISPRSEDGTHDTWNNHSTKRATTSSEGSGGLGFYNPKEPVFSLSLDLNPFSYSSSDTIPPIRGKGKVKETLTVDIPAKRGSGAAGRSRKKVEKKFAVHDEMVEVELIQDLSALRNRKGDTGSVLWRSRYLLLCSNLSKSLLK